MHLKQLIVGLASLGSLTAAAPAGNAVKGMRHEVREETASTTTSASIPDIPQNITDFIGQDASNQLIQLAEQDLLDQVKAYMARSADLQAIKNNIRLNSLTAQFPRVNTVLVVVTNIVDARNPSAVNKRYLVNSLFVDNGFPDKYQVVYATDAQEITVSPTAAIPTPTAKNFVESFTTTATTLEPTETTIFPPANPTNPGSNTSNDPNGTSNPDVNNPLFPNPPTFLPPTTFGNTPFTPPAIITTITQTITNILPLTTLSISTFTTTPFLDPTTAFLLPFASLPPSSTTALILPSDPASLIFANQVDLLGAACLGLGGGSGQQHLYGSAEQALAAQLAVLLEGHGQTGGFPPVVLGGHGVSGVNGGGVPVEGVLVNGVRFRVVGGRVEVKGGGGGWEEVKGKKGEGEEVKVKVDEGKADVAHRA